MWFNVCPPKGGSDGYVCLVTPSPSFTGPDTMNILEHLKEVRDSSVLGGVDDFVGERVKTKSEAGPMHWHITVAMRVREETNCRGKS